MKSTVTQRPPTVDAATALDLEPSSKDLKPVPHALQSAFLTGNVGKQIAVFMINGAKVTGKLRQFDQFTLLIEGQDGIRFLVFKHTISTIAPTC